MEHSEKTVTAVEYDSDEEYDHADVDCECLCCAEHEKEYEETDDEEEYDAPDWCSIRLYFTPNTKWKNVSVAYFKKNKCCTPADWTINLFSKPTPSKKPLKQGTLRYKVEFAGKLKSEDFRWHIHKHVYSVGLKLEADGKIMKSDFKMRMY